jgi:LmbE family N-acetylglucosaminyl deacetylase
VSEPTSSPTARVGPVLAVFHPLDDEEGADGGTLAKGAGAGREVHLLVLTNGDRGSGDPSMDRTVLAATRLRETQVGARVMGLASAVVLGVHDGELENTPEIRGAVVRRIREVRAQTLLSVDPTAWFFENRYYNHTDHRRAGEIALDAAFPGAGNPHFFSEHLEEGLEAVPVHDIWLGWTNEPNHHEDIGDTFRTKVDALAAHASQLDEGIAFFETFLREDAERSGEKIGTAFWEPFRGLDL